MMCVICRRDARGYGFAPRYIRVAAQDSKQCSRRCQNITARLKGMIDPNKHETNALAAAGFTRVWTVIDGFEGDTAKDGERKGQRVVNGWKNANPSWSYKLLKDQMYLDDL